MWYISCYKYGFSIKFCDMLNLEYMFQIIFCIAYSFNEVMNNKKLEVKYYENFKTYKYL